MSVSTFDADQQREIDHLIDARLRQQQQAHDKEMRAQRERLESEIERLQLQLRAERLLLTHIREWVNRQETESKHSTTGREHMTNELLQRVGAAAIRESQARAALAISEGRGQRAQARRDRAVLTNATNELRALIAEAEAHHHDDR
jgi:hypothetical protein